MSDGIKTYASEEYVDKVVENAATADISSEKLIEILGYTPAKETVIMYSALSQLELTSDNTITEVMAALPINSVLDISVATIESNLTTSLPVVSAGRLVVNKQANEARGYAIYYQYTANAIYFNRYYNKVFLGWERLANGSEVDKGLIYRGTITSLGLEDIATTPIGIYSSGNTSLSYGIRAYSLIYKPNAESFNGAFYICYQSGNTQDGIFVYRTSKSTFERLPVSDEIDVLQTSIDTINTELDTKNLKTYCSWAQLGVEDYTTLTSWAGVIPAGSQFIISINNAQRSIMFQNGLIPTENSGSLLVSNNNARGFALFVISGGAFYVGNSNNMNTENIVWNKVPYISDLDNYLPLTGGELTGSLTVPLNTIVKSDIREGVLAVQNQADGGNFGLWDNTNKKWILESNSDASLLTVNSALTTTGDITDGLGIKLSERQLKTYISLTSIGMSTSNTLEEVMTALPTYSELIITTAQGSTTFSKSLPTINTAQLRLFKGSNSARGIAEWKAHASNNYYINHYYNSAFLGWQKVVYGSDLESKVTLREAPTFASLADFWTDYVAQASNSGNCVFYRFKDSGGWTPAKSWWRAWVSSQNLAGGGYDVAGTIILINATDMYIGTISGGATDTSDLAVSWVQMADNNDLANYLPLNGEAVSAKTLTGLTSTVDELNYVDGVTSNIQTQLNAKLPLAGGAVTGGIYPSTDAATAGINLGKTDAAYGHMYSKIYQMYYSSQMYGKLEINKIGTTSAVGNARLILGNNLASGTDKNATSTIIMYGTSSGYTTIKPGYNSASNVTVTLPSKTGTLALTSDLTVNASMVYSGYTYGGETSAVSSTNLTIGAIVNHLNNVIGNLCTAMDNTLQNGKSYGGLKLSQGASLLWDTSAFVHSNAKQELTFAASGEQDYHMVLGVHDSMWSLYTYGNGVVSLGGPTNKWGQIYSTTGSISTSDKREKDEIENLSDYTDNIMAFLNDLVPVFYRLKNFNNSKRYSGLIAQDVEALMIKHSIPEDFGLLDKHYFINDDGNEDYSYGLCYEQLIPLLILAYQNKK